MTYLPYVTVTQSVLGSKDKHQLGVTQKKSFKIMNPAKTRPSACGIISTEDSIAWAIPLRHYLAKRPCGSLLRFASILLATHTFLSNVIQRARQCLYSDILFLNNFAISLTPRTSLKEFYWSAASIVNKKFWLSPNLYPRWVYIGSVFSIALPYNYGAVSKFLAAGVNWGGGLSLEL